MSTEVVWPSGWIPLGTALTSSNAGDTVTFTTGGVTTGPLNLAMSDITYYWAPLSDEYHIFQWSNDQPVRTIDATTWEQQAQLNRERQRAARARARSLLYDLLDESNRHRLDSQGCIEVQGSNGERYRIEADRYTGNVVQLARGEVTPSPNRFCCHLAEANLPIEDHVLAQMLMLQTDAPEFHRLANQWH